MVEQVGLRVARLIRTRVGSLQLGSLGPGEWRDLRPSEVARLRGSAA
jgi:23S rRNA pseudouridine2605 synthase